MKSFALRPNEPGSFHDSPVRNVGDLVDAEVLIIEDETLMSALMQRYLKTLVISDFSGHPKARGQVKILSVESGWELLNADLSHVRVAIVDVLLPQVTGVDLIRDFRRRYPGLGLVPVSGMATQPMKRALKELLPTGVELLSKPLRREEFVEAFLKAWNFSRLNGSSRPLKAIPLPFIQNSDPSDGPNGIDESHWSAGLATTNTAVSVTKRRKLLKKAA